MDPAEIDAKVERERAAEWRDVTPLTLWPENVASLSLIVALRTQMRMIAGETIKNGVAFTGLEYAAIEPTARMMEIPMSPERFADLRDCEAVLLPLLNGGRG